MNIFQSPDIPNWNFDYSLLDEKKIEQLEIELEQENSNIRKQGKTLKIPGFDSTDQEEESDEIEDDNQSIEEQDDWEMVYGDDDYQQFEIPNEFDAD